MKKLMIFLFVAFATQGMAQDVPPEVFLSQMKQLINNQDIVRDYGITAPDNSRHLYINLGCYDQYHHQEPIDVQGRKLFLWNPGAITFHQAEYPLNLLRINRPEDDMVFYEFTYQEGKKKFFIEVKFVKRYQDWEIVDIATTKLNVAY